ncbi:MAG: aspartate aminotransferase family protein [Rhodothermales bacterium]|nr:aspartate aminotransferase family protein [Rhodothermales bacterium]
MTADEFRHFGREIVDWIADYYATVEKYPVRSQVKPGEICDLLPGSPPEEPEPFERILADVDRVVMPGITHWQSPNFYGYFPANTSYPSILGELLSAGLGVQGMSWSTSPACTELETRVLDWLIDLLGLPESFRSTGSGGGVIQDSASSATLCAMLAARDRHRRGAGKTVDSTGVLTAYASKDAHSSVSKAAGIAGIGRENLRTIRCSADRAMDVTDLRDQILADRQAGHQPFFVCAIAGTTSTLAFDPLEEIGSICSEFGLWLHVDGAMAGSAAVCPEFRFVHAGLELADSYCFNPHKWLLTNFDCDCFYVKDRNDLLEALSILPEYLRNAATDSGLVIDYRDWQIPLGRRFRALKLWFTMRAYGARGLREHIRRHVAIASALREWIAADSGFEIVRTPRLNLVCFRHRGGDEINRRAMEQVNSTGRMFITHTSVDGQFVLRFCVGQPNTTLDHVRASWELLASAFHSLE